MLREILHRDLVSGARQGCIQCGAAFAHRRERAVDLRFTFADIGIDLLLIEQGKR